MAPHGLPPEFKEAFKKGFGGTLQGMQAHIQEVAKHADVDLVIGCVDTRKARRALGMLTRLLHRGFVSY
jgi:hypothetical protein